MSETWFMQPERAQNVPELNHPQVVNLYHIYQALEEALEADLSPQNKESFNE